MIRMAFQSDLAAPPAAVWQSVSRMSGVNRELGPILRMTKPGGDDSIVDAPDGQARFSSWVLLFGVLPIDRHFLSASLADPEIGFDENSSSWTERVWRHRRRLTAVPGGTRVSDQIEFEPRLRILAPVIARFVRGVFRHRHQRLRRQFDEA